MRFCLIYDCLYPWTIGGAERIYRALAERLAQDGHEVTYLTLRQWDADDEPAIPDVRVLAVGRRHALYTDDGRRRIWPPVAFGAGVARHLLRYGHRYDVVRTVSFPYFSLLAATIARARCRYALEVDWFEVWSREYWRSYLGAIPGTLGWTVQSLCAQTEHRAFAWSQMHAARLGAQGHRGKAIILRGALTQAPEPRGPAPGGDRLLYAGRLVPEKNPAALIRALAALPPDAAAVGLDVFGDGPQLGALEALALREGVAERVHFHGFVARSVLENHLREALCVCVPSRREGYGLVVVEAAAQGVPAIVARTPDNAAVELVQDDVNGFVAPSDQPADLADAVQRIRVAGDPLRDRTAHWYRQERIALTLESSLARVASRY